MILTGGMACRRNWGFCGGLPRTAGGALLPEGWHDTEVRLCKECPRTAGGALLPEGWRATQKRGFCKECPHATGVCLLGRAAETGGMRGFAVHCRYEHRWRVPLPGGPVHPGFYGDCAIALLRRIEAYSAPVAPKQGLLRLLRSAPALCADTTIFIVG